MVRRVTFILLWVLATMLATGVGLAAVRSVAGQVVDAPHSELLALQTTTTAVDHSILVAAASAAASTETAEETEDPLEVTTGTEVPQLPSPDDEPARSEVAAGADAPSADEAAAPEPETDGTGAEGADAPSVTNVSEHQATTDEDQTAPPAKPPQAVDAAEMDETTYQLDGGWVRITFAEEGVVKLDAAGPLPGFTMIISDTGPEQVSIAFRGRDHQSRLRASWREGELEVDVVEADRRG